ncbi:MAG: hypothetical protein JKY34_12685 [Kordiimonadaceae bacterium]|nr:hypothetical protein [Kordiimonadaceae bacterium]
MAITYPLDMPTSPAPRGASLYIIRMQTSERSFSGFLQVQPNPGDRWTGKITMPTLSKDQAQEWTGFFASLNGLLGSFLLPHPDFKTMRGSANGSTGFVLGGGQKGTEIATTGWPANATFKRGDMLQFGTGAKARMKQVSIDAQASSSGAVTLDVEPAFLIAPDHNATIETTDVKGVFRLAESSVVPQSDLLSHHVLSFPVEEVLK